MAMGTKQSEQGSMWVASVKLPKSPGHPFYTRLNALLEAEDFDRFVEGLCAKFYAPVMGRPSLAPGRYFRLLLVGYFEGIDSERGIAWRATDSLAIRSFLHLAVEEPPPDHSTLSRTRRTIDLESHRAVFTWVLQRLVAAGLLKGKTIAIDATTLEANAAMRSIVRRDTGESYQEYLTGLAKASGIETPTREDLARLDRKRKKKTSNQDWKHPWDPDAKIAKMKDGRTHLAHKAEHAVDLETGALLAVTLQDADQGDTTTILETAIAAAEQIEDAQATVQAPQALQELIADKGYHSNQTMLDLAAVGLRSYVAEPDRGRRDWSQEPQAQTLVYANRRRIRGSRGRRLMRQRGERIERSFAHLYDTGAMRRTHLRGHPNILKRLLIHAGGFNLGLVMRHLLGSGTPRGLQDRPATVITALLVLLRAPRRWLVAISASHPLIAAVRCFSVTNHHHRLILSRATTYTTGC
jgi:transposase